MKRAIVVLIGVLCACSVRGEEVLEEFSWSKLQAEGRLKNGEVVRPGKGKPFESLAVVNEEGEGRTVTVLTIDRPKVTAATYALRGEVSCEDVEGTGYLEMWNHFPDGSAYPHARLLGHAPEPDGFERLASVLAPVLSQG